VVIVQRSLVDSVSLLEMSLVANVTGHNAGRAGTCLHAIPTPPSSFSPVHPPALPRPSPSWAYGTGGVGRSVERRLGSIQSSLKIRAGFQFRTD